MMERARLVINLHFASQLGLASVECCSIVWALDGQVALTLTSVTGVDGSVPDEPGEPELKLKWGDSWCDALSSACCPRPK